MRIFKMRFRPCTFPYRRFVTQKIKTLDSKISEASTEPIDSIFFKLKVITGTTGILKIKSPT